MLFLKRNIMLIWGIVLFDLNCQSSIWRISKLFWIIPALWVVEKGNDKTILAIERMILYFCSIFVKLATSKTCLMLSKKFYSNGQPIYELTDDTLLIFSKTARWKLPDRLSMKWCRVNGRFTGKPDNYGRWEISETIWSTVPLWGTTEATRLNIRRNLTWENW